MTDTEREREYVLGTEDAEIHRLRVQHEAWVAETRALWRTAGLGPGQVLLDIGAGPGFTSFDLARVVGPTGQVIARDESARFLAFLEAERARRGQGWIEVSHGRVEELELPPDSIDGAYARWLFCWLADPRIALERVARALRPGGVIALQEYVDWAAMKLLPPAEPFDRAVAACMRSWRESGGAIDVGERLPAIGQELGLAVEHLQPVARAGGVGSPEWRWVGGFLASYLPKLVARGLFAEAERADFAREWRDREERGAGHLLAPIVLDLVLRKPRGA